MGSRRKKGIPDFNLSYYMQTSSSDKRFSTIYEGMLKCEKWKGLTPTAKYLYIAAATHTQTVENFKAMKWYAETEGLDEQAIKGRGYFILTREQLDSYGINGSHASKYFKELVDAGFIEYVHRNQHRKKANLYRLSSQWKKEPPGG